jgi:pSer/pThr/pTyr-binding forkhead associated (FHA) protein
LDLAGDQPPTFRPSHRPPTPLLTVLDDGSEEGEAIRIRTESFVIGRSEGNLIIPNDSQMSSRHAELRCTRTSDRCRWRLSDLQSTNGTFVRISSAALDHGQEFCIGRTRFRFDNAVAATAPNAAAAGVSHNTKPWRSGRTTAPTPTIVEMTPTGDGPKTAVAERELWIGSDVEKCQVPLPNDPFASARHARVRLGDDGRWIIENNKSPNGVWLRIEQISIKGTCQFLLGEQRFQIRVADF